MRIFRADVPEPIWDQIKGIMVVPEGLTETQVYQTMVRLICERNLCGHGHGEGDVRNAAGE